jgi:hypothetical protein
VRHHIGKEDRSLLDAENDPVAAADPGFQVILVGENRLDPQARGVGLLDECDDCFVTGCLTLGAQFG